MKMKLRLMALMVVFSINAQDEFFQPTKSIGGYGELHYNSSKQGKKDGTKTLDFHRFIIYYSASFTEAWSFFSEVELEHNFVNDGEGELELEQAFVEYRSDKGGFKAGVILPTAGLLNEYHEPPLFLSVERPEYSKYVIPTTWFANGISANYKPMDGLKLRVALLEDLNGEGVGSGLRSARGKGYKTTAHDWTKNFSAEYTGLPGLRLGGSYTMNNAPINDDPDTTANVALLELHAKYVAHNIYAIFEYGNINYDGTNHTPSYKSSGGYYLDLGYNMASILNLKGKLMPWFRFSDYNQGTNDDGVLPSKHYTITRFGVTFWPVDKVAFKIDFGTKETEDADIDEISQLNVGVGYNF
jgi:hypothetical protein